MRPRLGDHPVTAKDRPLAKVQISVLGPRLIFGRFKRFGGVREE